MGWVSTIEKLIGNQVIGTIEAGCDSVGQKQYYECRHPNGGGEEDKRQTTQRKQTTKEYGG